MKQLGLALMNFHDAQQGFPPAKLDNTAPYTYPTTSWTPFILPYIEQTAVYQRYNFNVDYNAAPNDVNPSGPIQTVIKTFLCPSAPSGRLGSKNAAILDYDATNQVTRPNSFVTNMPASDGTFLGVLGHNVYRRITEVTDGTSNTILLAESAGRNQTWKMGQMTSSSGQTGAWANPGTEIVVTGFNIASNSTLGACAVNCTNANEIYAFHPGGANILLTDGSVHVVKAQTDINVVIALMTRAHGDVVPPGAFN